MSNVDAFIIAVRDLNLACNALGIKKPRSIDFGTGKDRNFVSEAAMSHKAAGLPCAHLVSVDRNGTVEIDGVPLKVQF